MLNRLSHNRFSYTSNFPQTQTEQISKAFKYDIITLFWPSFYWCWPRNFFMDFRCMKTCITFFHVNKVNIYHLPKCSSNIQEDIWEDSFPFSVALDMTLGLPHLYLFWQCQQYSLSFSKSWVITNMKKMSHGITLIMFS